MKPTIGARFPRSKSALISLSAIQCRILMLSLAREMSAPSLGVSVVLV